jgi:hypothetical protein
MEGSGWRQRETFGRGPLREAPGRAAWRSRSSRSTLARLPAHLQRAEHDELRDVGGEVAGHREANKRGARGPQRGAAPEAVDHGAPQQRADADAAGAQGPRREGGRPGVSQRPWEARRWHGAAAGAGALLSGPKPPPPGGSQEEVDRDRARRRGGVCVEVLLDADQRRQVDLVVVGKTSGAEFRGLLPGVGWQQRGGQLGPCAPGNARAAA